MSAGTDSTNAPLGADRVAESDANDDVFIPTERLSELTSRIAQLSRRLTRMGAPPLRVVDTGKRRGSFAMVRLQGEGSIVRDWEIVCVLHHQGGVTRVEPCVPMSERQVERLARARALCEACRTVRPRKQTFIVRERPTGRTIQLGSSCLRPLTGLGVGRGGDPTRADRGEDPNRPRRRRVPAASSGRAVHRHERVSRPRRQRRTQSRLSPQRRGGRHLAGGADPARAGCRADRERI